MRLARCIAPITIAWMLLGSISCTTSRALSPAPRPTHEQVRAQLSTAEDLYLAGSFETAADLFRGAAWALDDRLSRMGAWYWYGRCALALDRLEEARRAFQRALHELDEVQPSSATLEHRSDFRAHCLVALGDTLLRQQKHGEALECFLRVEAEGLAPRTDAGLLAFRKATALEGLDRADLARPLYARAARILPDRSMAREAVRRSQRLTFAYYRTTAGVYTSRSSAESVVRALNDRGVDARVEIASTDGRYAVALGRFDRLEDAERAATQARASGIPARVSTYRSIRSEAAR